MSSTNGMSPQYSGQRQLRRQSITGRQLGRASHIDTALAHGMSKTWSSTHGPHGGGPAAGAPLHNMPASEHSLRQSPPASPHMQPRARPSSSGNAAMYIVRQHIRQLLAPTHADE